MTRAQGLRRGNAHHGLRKFFVQSTTGIRQHGQQNKINTNYDIKIAAAAEDDGIDWGRSSRQKKSLSIPLVGPPAPVNRSVWVDEGRSPHLFFPPEYPYAPLRLPWTPGTFLKAVRYTTPSLTCRTQTFRVAPATPYLGRVMQPWLAHLFVRMSTITSSACPEQNSALLSLPHHTSGPFNATNAWVHPLRSTSTVPSVCLPYFLLATRHAMSAGVWGNRGG